MRGCFCGIKSSQQDDNKYLKKQLRQKEKKNDNDSLPLNLIFIRKNT